MSIILRALLALPAFAVAALFATIAVYHLAGYAAYLLPRRRDDEDLHDPAWRNWTVDTLEWEIDDEENDPDPTSGTTPQLS